MCGIIGYIGKKDSKEVLLNSLKKLEYRGYDSSGIALFAKNKYKIIKCKGKIINLENKVNTDDFDDTNIGIGHTRWATHGIANDINAHPHEGKTCVLVHNGIIENYEILKANLLNKGHVFYSDVDSEVIAKLIDEYKEESNINTLVKVCKNLEGSYALNIIFKDESDKIYFIKKDSPLIIGANESKKYICSDINSVSDYCRNFIYL